MVVILGQGDAAREERFLKQVAVGSVELVKSFIEEGVDVNARDAQGRTALHLVAEAGQVDKLRYLCTEAKADVDARDNMGATPVMLAFDAELSNAAEYLIERAGADTQALDSQGRGLASRLFDSQKVRRDIAGDGLVWLAVKHVDDLQGKTDGNGRNNLHKLLALPDLNNLERMLVSGIDPHQGRKPGLLLPGDKSPSHAAPPAYVALEQLLNNQFADTMAKDIIKVFRELPRVPDDLSGMNSADLTAPNDKGYRLLDNPLLWKRMPEVITVLEAKGEPLPARKELTKTGVMGHTPLSIALHTRRFDAAEQCLKANGESISGADFANSQKSGLSKFGFAAVETNLLNEKLMTLDRWAGKLPELRTFYQELPQDARDSLKHYQQLTQQVRATMPQTQNIGR